MALVSLPWVHERWGFPFAFVGLANPGFSSLLLDAAADRITMLGRFVHKDRTTKTVDRVGFLLGTVSKGAGSTLQVSLQDVSLTAGPPIREDGTPDQTLTIANADAGFASNLWYEAAFDGAATRSLTPGDMVAVVLQFGTFVASDTVNIRGVFVQSSNWSAQQGVVVANLTGTYVPQAIFPNVALRCSDGTYGTLEDGFVCTAFTQHAVNLNTGTADEYALGIQYPMGCQADGLSMLAGLATAGDQTELILYSGTTALATVNLDHNAIANLNNRPFYQPIAPQTLTANTLYRVGIRPLGTADIVLISFDVAFANHLQCHPGGTVAHLWTRLNQGAWGGEVATRRLMAGIRLSAFDDGAGGGGGGLARIIGG